jgi:hypothetical protein
MLDEVAHGGVPQEVLRDPRLGACSAPEQIGLELPHLVVTPSIRKGAVVLHIRFLSVLAAHADPSTGSRVRAFIRLDGQPILLELPGGSSMALTFADLRSGVHRIQYGVFDGTTLLNGGIACVRI